MGFLQRSKQPEMDVRIEQAEREVEDLKRRVARLEAQSEVFQRKAKKVLEKAA